MPDAHSMMFRTFAACAIGGVLLLGTPRPAAALKISDPIPVGYELDSFEPTPDGQHVVYALVKEGGVDTVRLVVVPVGGGVAKTLVDIPLTGSQRSVDTWDFTPDGSRIVFLSDKDAPQQFRDDLFSVPIDGSAAPLKLNVAPATNDLDTFRITSDSARIVFEGAANKIYSVPTIGGTVAELGVGTGSFLPRYRIAPDNTRVVFTFNDGLGGGTQIYSVPITGGTPTKLTDKTQVSLPGSNGPSAERHAITPDGTKVLFFAANSQELWVTPIDQMAQVKLAGPLAIYGADFRLTPDGTTAVFTAGTHPAFRIYRVPVDGSTTEQAVSGVGQNVVVSEYQLSANGQSFVYRVFANSKFRLFAVGLAGGNDVPLTPAVPVGVGPYNGYGIDLAGQRVVYFGEQDAAGVIELYSVPIGGGASVKLSKNPMPATSDVDFGSVELSPDGATVLFVADQDTDTVNELFSTGLASGGPQKVHPDLAPDKDVGSDPDFTPNSQKIVYLADQDTEGLLELFVTDDPAPGVTATPTPGAGATATATPTPVATSTPTPLATRTPAPETDDRCTDCIDNDYDGAVDRADPECPARADGAGSGLAGDAAKSALKCQKALGKLGTAFAATRVKALGGCLQKAFDCVQKGGDPACLAKAGAACGKAEAGRQAAVPKLAAAVAKSCGDPPVAASDLGAAAGLGFAAEATGCGDFGAAIGDAAGIAACMVARHACRAEQLVGMQLPRAGELLTVANRNAALEAPCLPPGIPGGNVADVKPVLKCQKTIAKAGATYGAARLKAKQKCADGVFACVQVKPTDTACRPKAEAGCTKLDAKVAAAGTKLAAALAKGCGFLGLPDLLGAGGLGFGLRSGECTALATAPDPIAAIAGCITAQHACRVDQILLGQTPRADELGAPAP